jgi:hypothetical protein
MMTMVIYINTEGFMKLIKSLSDIDVKLKSGVGEKGILLVVVVDDAFVTPETTPIKFPFPCTFTRSVLV